MQRITRNVVDNKVAILNSMLGLSNDAFSRVPGSFGIYQHTTVNVVRYSNNGAHETLFTGNMREAATYLSGMLAALHYVK